MTETKEVVVKEANAVAAASADAWGDSYVGATDILIPKILPMQGLSDLVTDGKAVMGEFRDSITGAKIGSISEPFEVIPFYVEKHWDILKENDEGDFQWLRTEPLIENPVQPGYNDDLPWSDTEDGVAIKRVRRMNFYVLLPSEIANGTAVPYIISFKSTSFRAGRKMFSQMYMRNKRANLAPCAFAFVVSGTKEKNEKGTFIVPDVELGRKATPEEVSEAFNWFTTVKKGGVKVDDSDVVDAKVMAADVVDTGTGEY